MLNKYVWDLYLLSGGNEIVELFEKNLTTGFTLDYAECIRDLHRMYNPCEHLVDENYQQLTWLVDELEFLKHEVENPTVDSGLDLLWATIVEMNDPSIKEIEIFEIFIESISFFTTLLAMNHPKLFIPYYFKFNFNLFTMIAEEFGINVPEIPRKSDYKGRFLYYGRICESLNDFKQENNLSVYELCAFLYDFAPNYLGGYKSYIIKELCEPRSAYLIGGTINDMYYSENPTAITAWQCKPSTRAGDMLLMYLRSPISAIDSIWRSVSIGFVDPFFYYYRITYIGNPCTVKKLSIKDLKNDNKLKEMSIVRKNMQGVNGTELKPSEYNYILDLCKSDLPRLECSINCINGEFTCEKDVEEKLVKVLLSKLGYNKIDYVQQLYIPIGNNNNLLIPDFVLLPRKVKGHHSCFAVIETKLNIDTDIMLNKARIQARSYSKQLNAIYSIVASSKKIWIYSKEDDYIDCIYHETWDKLSEVDAFNNIKKLIEKR